MHAGKRSGWRETEVMEVEEIAELTDKQVAVIEARWRSASSTGDCFAGRERLREFADMRVERGLAPLAIAGSSRTRV